MSRLIEFDIAKGLGIILVVVGHLNFPSCVINWIFLFHMPLFFMISGYFFKSTEPLRMLFVKRLKSLVVPYLCFYFIDFVLFGLLYENYFSNFSFSIGQDIALWFLPILFISELLYKFLYKWKYIYVIMAFTYSVCNSYYFHIGSQIINLCLWGSALYGFGNCLKTSGWLVKIKGNPKSTAFVSLIVSVLVAYKFYPTLNILFNIVGNPIFVPIGMFFGCAFIYSLSCLISETTSLNKALSWIGQNTIVILCMHQVLYAYIKTYINVNPYLLMILLRLVVLWITMILIIWLCNKKLKFLVGK